MARVAKNLPANAADISDTGSIPGSGGSPGGGHGNPHQHSCLENPMDRGAWQATVHGVAKSQTRLSDFISLQQLSANFIPVCIQFACLVSPPKLYHCPFQVCNNFVLQYQKNIILYYQYKVSCIFESLQQGYIS